jgi:membrane fusion protein, multidrug efflux system
MNDYDSVRFKAGASRRVRFARRLAYAALGAVLVACGRGPAEPPQKGAAAPTAMPVKVQKMETRRVPVALEAVGQAEGSREVEVRARVSGIVERRLYTEGAPVKAGTVLFTIDRALYEIAVAQAKAALAQERARQEQAQREAERLKSLADARAISQREYDDARSNVQLSSASIDVARARLAEAELNLSYTRVTAPIGGITGRALRSEGSLVTANTDSSLLTTITQVHPIWVRFSLAESEFERIRGTERRASVKLLTQDGEVAAENGRLNFAATSVDPKLGTVQLRAEFANPGARWLPGQFLRVQILAGEQDAFLVPQAAVMQTEKGHAVWVVGPEGTAGMRPVTTANWLGGDWIVTGGLKAGDLVIVDNLMRLRPGAPVQPLVPGESLPAHAAAAKARSADSAPAAQGASR